MGALEWVVLVVAPSLAGWVAYVLARRQERRWLRPRADPALIARLEEELLSTRAQAADFEVGMPFPVFDPGVAATVRFVSEHEVLLGGVSYTLTDDGRIASVRPASTHGRLTLLD